MIRYLSRQYPELEYFERKDLQKWASEAVTMARHEAMRSWSCWLVWLAFGVLFTIAAVVAPLILKPIGTPKWVGSLLYVGGWVVFNWAIWRVSRNRI